MAITVELPQEIEEMLPDEWPELERQALEALVVEAYRQKKIGTHIVGRVLGFRERWETVDFLSTRGVYPNYDADEFEQDIRTLEALKREAGLVE